ncbi:MAG: phosphate/phosphite/phosphonate ABC transporter substrate-binding protein [Flavobacteriales bacterium]|jgi:phosphonate transport system substrate-binding protein|nr:phosphate/phosphite/phosphonate ABC transporter substrate-binding protein [Flavobacteriales bacterium]
MNIYRKIFTIIAVVLLSVPFSISQAESMNLKMVFVPASEKGDDKDYVNLINIIGDLTGIEITPIRVTDYNAAVEAVRANRAQIAWYGGKTYIQAAEIADVEAFAAGVRKGDSDASYFAYFVVPADSKLQTLEDIKGKTLALNSIGSTSGDLIPQVELMKVDLSVKNKNDFEKVYYAGSHDACLMAVLNNHVDVCGMSSRNFDARILDGTFKLEQVRIIHRSNPVPPPPLAYSKKLPIEVRNKIKQATLEAHKYGTIGGYGGEMSHYIEVTDADYDLLREVDRLLSSQ